MRLEGREQLLEDVLISEVLAGARDRGFARVMSAVRRRRRLREFGRRVILPMLLAAGVGGWWIEAARPAPETRPANVPSKSLRLTSRALPARMKVRSGDMASVEMVTSQRAVDLVVSGSEPEVLKRIGDDELVLLAGLPAVVVHFGDQKAELVRLRRGME